MEEFVYILLAIVWLVISILGGRKKKASKPPAPKSYEEPATTTSTTPTSEKKSEFEDLLDDFFGADTTVKKPQPAPQPTYMEERDQRRMDDRSRDERRRDASSMEERDERRRDDRSRDERRDDGRRFENSPFEEVAAEEVEKFEGAVEEDFEFSAEGKVETLEDLIKSYERSNKKTEEEDAKLAVVELDEEETFKPDFDFDARKAIIYAEIINRKHFR